MQVAYDLLKIIQDGRFHSGTTLAKSLKVARTSIWKAIQFLQSLELEIYAVPGRGYRLAERLEMLDRALIYQKLNETVGEHLQQLDLLNLTTSTNEYLVQRAHPNLLSGYACVAEGQTAGRGRMGRKWISPFGANLYFSIYWHFNLSPMQLSSLSLVVGVAVVQAIRALIESDKLKIKWPNDLFFDGMKLGGILIENLPHQGTVIGIGINVAKPKEIKQEAQQPVSALEDVCGYSISRNDLVAALLNALIPAFKLFQQSGFSAFRAEWEKYDYLKGQTISLSLGSRLHTGVCLGVNDRGELCLESAGTKYAFQCGEATIFKKNNAMKNCYV